MYPIFRKCSKFVNNYIQIYIVYYSVFSRHDVIVRWQNSERQKKFFVTYVISKALAHAASGKIGVISI